MRQAARKTFGFVFYAFPRPLRLVMLVVFIGVPLVVSGWFNHGVQSKRLIGLLERLIGHD